MGDRGIMGEPYESEDDLIALDRAAEHLMRTRDKIYASRIEGVRSGRQYEIELEGLERALEYQTNRLMQMSHDELASLDFGQLAAFLWTSYRYRRLDVGEEATRAVIVSIDDARDWDWRDARDPLASLHGIRLNESVALLVVGRMIELMLVRKNKPKLSDDDHVTVARFYLDCDLGLPLMTAKDTGLKKTFPDSGRQWKQPLAAALGRPPSYVTYVLKEKILPATRTAIYLFILLAPVGRAVLKEAQMGPLLDLVFQSNRHLETYQRKLLERAPRSLLRDDDSFLVDVAKLAENPGTAGPMSLSETIAELHVAEARYAARVPSQQYRPPRFRCVARCNVHLPIEEI